MTVEFHICNVANGCSSKGPWCSLCSHMKWQPSHPSKVTRHESITVEAAGTADSSSTTFDQDHRINVWWVVGLMCVINVGQSFIFQSFSTPDQRHYPHLIWQLYVSLRTRFDSSWKNGSNWTTGDLMQSIPTMACMLDPRFKILISSQRVKEFPTYSRPEWPDCRLQLNGKFAEWNFEFILEMYLNVIILISASTLYMNFEGTLNRRADISQLNCPMQIP